jgi:integrator complex subunit 1
MDRNKKSKIQHSSDSLFILGKNPERKREAATVPIAPSSKKPKLGLASHTSAPASSSSSSAGADSWEDAINAECENFDLISSVLQATDQQDSDKIVSLVCSAIKSLSSPKTKNDSVLITSLLYLAKIRPHIFGNDKISAAMSSLLKTDNQHAVRLTMKNNSPVFAMAANLLSRGNFDKKKWPESFIKMYIDDAVNERLWVDLEECSFFTDHISKLFQPYVHSPD